MCKNKEKILNNKKTNDFKYYLINFLKVLVFRGNGGVVTSGEFRFIVKETLSAICFV